MFEKNEDRKEIKSKISGVDKISYTELVSREYNTELIKFIEERKRLEYDINEALAANKKGEFTATIVRLREEEVINAKAEQKARSNQPDITSILLANDIDLADSHNKGRALLLAIGPKINEILAMLPEIESCYRCSIYTPRVLINIRHSLEGLAIVMNSELPNLNILDKEEKTRQLKARMEILEKRRIETEAISNKHKKLF